MPKIRIGVLSLQGAVEPHLSKLSALDCETRAVRNVADLQLCDALILPGGESTTMIHLAKQNGLWDALKAFVKVKPSWGVCAGAILLAKQVSHPQQDSLCAVDVTIERNGFGRQLNSFIGEVECTNGKKIEAYFIRAPRIQRVGSGATVLGMWRGEPVFVEEGLARLSTFHPELTEELTLHRDFLKKCQSTSQS